MRRNRPAIVLLVTAHFFLNSTYAQLRDYTIPLKNKSVTPRAGLDNDLITRLNKAVTKGPTAIILQFQSLPTEQQRKLLESKGIQLLNYIGGHAYVAGVRRSLEQDALKSAGARALLAVDPSEKINGLLHGVSSTVTVQASIFSFATPDNAINLLNEKGFIASRAFDNYPVLQITVPAGKLKELADCSFIEYIEPLPPPPTELNYKSRAGTRANVLHAPNYNLDGEGVMFQINELPGFPQGHIDFMSRSVNGLTQQGASAYHPTHVHGIAAGAGIVNELYKGYAPKARFISSDPFISLTPANVIAYGVDLTNNSWGSGGTCTPNTIAVNDLATVIADKQALDFKSLIHVFAAGNSGIDQCPQFPTGYNTVYSGYQSAKSVLTVGSATSDGQLADYSSRGPGKGRRLKPEIVAPGVNIWSTVPDNRYGTNNGTSMACPAAMGGLALLYQRYEQLHGTKPENSLMKPLLCNSATDLGPIGPDYGYGFGFMNLNRAIKVLDAGYYYKDSVTNYQTKTKTITVPNGIAQLKIMLYWQDPPASPLSARTLVNDLDIKITTANGTVILPYVLDTLPALVANAATHGVDHVNNIEQVIVDAPAAGIYTISVEGYEVGEGTFQPYHVVYDMVPDEVELTFPAHNESLAPGDAVSVQWDNWGNRNSTFTLEFSNDNGQSWQTLSSTIAAGATSFDWTVPSVITTQARLRITRNSDGKRSSPEAFRIIDVPAIQLSASQCPGSIAIEWPVINGASDYEVMWYRNGDMVPIATTATNSYVFSNLSEDSVYWVTVRARNNGIGGRRAYALSRQPNTGNCASAVYDNDLKADALAAPQWGRQFTSTKLGMERIRMRIKNLDDKASSGFDVAYSVNGQPWVHENITAAVAANASFDYSFQTPYDFSTAGDYLVRLAVTNPGDGNKGNDTLTYTVRHLPNQPLDLNTGWTEDFESIPSTDYKSNYTGLKGLERFDYEKFSLSPYLRIGNHYTQNPSKGLEMVYNQLLQDIPKQQSITTTFNLSAYDTAQHSVALDFSYWHNAQGPVSFDSLLVRGSDTSSWILIQDLDGNSNQSVSKEFKGIILSDYLKANKQNFSSSLQVRLSLSNSYNPVLIDNLKLYNSTSDIAVISIDSIQPYSCGLSSMPVRITLQNRSCSDVPDLVLKYRIDKAPVVSETLSLLSASATAMYRFAKQADLSATGFHTIEVWTEYANDSYHQNDTARFTLRNQPLATAFPFIEDFEKNDGGWYTGGTNPSWHYGTPSSPRINGAASGSKAWKTNLDGNYNAPELSFLYTGCYDFSQLTKPVISMSIAMNTDSCPQPISCDAMLLQYSVNGRDWISTPARSVYNWTPVLTSKWYNRWHVISERPKDTATIIQFRFVFRADAYNTFEGIGIDDFHVYDSSSTIYEGSSADVQQQASSSQQWMEFRKDGKLLAALQPGIQNPGNVQLQTFVHAGGVRNFHGQYYLDRNFVFKPANPLTDSAILRLYFTDKEADSLLFAHNCNECTKTQNAYRFGISSYKTTDLSELDSSIANNRKGAWNFISNNQVKTVPFANGYYVEFKVKDAAEFRLSNGGLNNQSDLPVQLETFSAEKIISNSLLQWRTASEINIDRFEIEVAIGNEAYQSGQFQKIGEVKSKGRSASAQSYSYTDTSIIKKTVRYYRLKSIDVFGNYTYSNALPVVFEEELVWQVFPNPSNGKYSLVYQSAPGNLIQVRLLNAIGELIRELQLTATGFVQKQEIDLSKTSLPAGVYILQMKTTEKMHVLKLIKQ